jgi:hypothetical protein
LFVVFDILEVVFAKDGMDHCGEVGRFQIEFFEGAIFREILSCKFFLFALACPPGPLMRAGEPTSSCWKWGYWWITTTLRE